MLSAATSRSTKKKRGKKKFLPLFLFLYLENLTTL
nr:MAG TPA: hypothetical protein [Caudoviricetes sp.]